jgi:hypothetical protein
MPRAYFHAGAKEFLGTDSAAILGELANDLPFAMEMDLRRAWNAQVEHLKEVAEHLPDAYFFFEFVIPRMGRRADVVLIYKGLLFVIEYKVGAGEYSSQAIDQTFGYALDLKHFHETSHGLPIIPILVATDADEAPVSIAWMDDKIMQPLRTNRHGLVPLLLHLAENFAQEEMDPICWMNGRYKPTPTIIEAAQALYRGHRVEDISRSEAGVENLTKTSEYIATVIESAKRSSKKAVCFVTGVPGSGKTLAGLSIANDRTKAHEDEHAVFLSGNGPLVDVLREALTNDALEQRQQSSNPASGSRKVEYQRTCRFIQNIHHFRDHYLDLSEIPDERVVIFDEAQRAWNQEQASKFMRTKRGRESFELSEPRFLLSVMDLHRDWCVVICLIGGGQEINTGEAGLSEWIEALAHHFPEWELHLPSQILGPEYLPDPSVLSGFDPKRLFQSDDLHLSVSVR